MIRRLRKKFVAAAIIAVFLVLFVLIGSINVLNYRNLISDADSTLQILADNKGAFPAPFPGRCFVRRIGRRSCNPRRTRGRIFPSAEGAAAAENWLTNHVFSRPGSLTAVSAGSIWTTLPL